MKKLVLFVFALCISTPAFAYSNWFWDQAAQENQQAQQYYQWQQYQERQRQYQMQQQQMQWANYQVQQQNQQDQQVYGLYPTLTPNFYRVRRY